MGRLGISCVFVVLFGLSACTTVTVTEPLGQNAVELEPGDWEGLWRSYLDDDPVFVLVEVLDAENGLLELTSVDSDAETSTVYVRESNDWLFASYREDDSPDSNFEWVRIERAADVITVWLPDSSRFVELVQSGTLPGIITRNPNTDWVTNVTLTDLQPEHIDLITSSSEGVLLDWERPGFLVRISDEVGRSVR